MTSPELRRIERKGLAAWVRRFPRVHRLIGLGGNALFVSGSVLFLIDRSQIGLYLFLVGSIGMFFGQLGEVIRTWGEHRLKRDGLDPQRGTGQT